MNDSKKKAVNKLKTARGQIDGIIKMLEDDRYCVDVSTQILSAIGLLKKANIDVLNDHIRSCVTTAILQSEDQGNEKIEEIITIIDKYIKWKKLPGVWEVFFILSKAKDLKAHIKYMGVSFCL